MNRAAQFDIFLSSRMYLEEERSQLIDLCEDVLGFSVWDYTRQEEDAIETSGSPVPLEGVQEFCLEGVRNSKSIVAIVDGTYGSPWFNPAELSVLELELVHAAMLRKRIFIFLYSRDATSAIHIQPDLEPVLSALHHSHSEIVWQEVRGPQALRFAARNVIQRELARESQPKGHQAFSLCLELLARARGRLDHVRIEPSLDATFLDGNVCSGAHTSRSPGEIEALFEEAGTIRGHYERLTFLWSVFRVLSYWIERKDASATPLFIRMLEIWASSAAWCGLHGHQYLGRLAAVNSLHSFRLDLGSTSMKNHGSFGIDVRGSLASEYYSIGKLVKSYRIRRRLLRRADVLLDDALDEPNRRDPSGLWGIKGSVHLHLLRPFSARDCYERMLAHRINSNDSPGRIGEAEVELGLAHVFAGNVRQGQRLMLSGIEKLRTSDRPEFLVRALRKASRFYEWTFRTRQAISLREEALGLAQKYQLTGQLSRFESENR